MNCKEKLLEVRDLHKVYTKEGVPTKALNGITFNVLNGEYLGIMGASGSGKTTILFFNWTYIVCGIAVSVLCVLILTKVQKNTENSK